MWKDKPGGTKEDHWIDLIWTDNPDESTYWWSECSVKWDGCIHYSIAGNIPFEQYLDSNSNNREVKGACDDYFHICDIDDIINKLIELKKIAMNHFKDSEEWERMEKKVNDET